MSSDEWFGKRNAGQGVGDEKNIGHRWLKHSFSWEWLQYCLPLMDWHPKTRYMINRSLSMCRKGSDSKTGIPHIIASCINLGDSNKVSRKLMYTQVKFRYIYIYIYIIC